jgi:hypothetical protein
MWVCLNKSFLSIVTPGSDPQSKQLLVRARVPGHIEAVFPDAVVEKRPERDYLFRALIDRELVAVTLSSEVWEINYNNFKNSVKNRPLHDAFARIWGVMASLQPTRPYSGANRGGLF